MTRISEHFTLDEFYSPQNYRDVLQGRQAPKATSAEIDPRIVTLLEGLREKFRTRYPDAAISIRPHGGYRPEPLNTMVGGARNSQHRLGNAADFSIVTGGQKLEAALTAVYTEKYMAELGIRGGIGMYRAQDRYIHVDARGRDVRWYASTASVGCPGHGGVPCLYRKGLKGAGVVLIQRALGVPEDGKFGAQTQRALVLWQMKNGLKADGVYGSACNHVLRALPWED